VNNPNANGAEVLIGKSGNDGDHAWCERGPMNGMRMRIEASGDVLEGLAHEEREARKGLWVDP